MQNSQVIWNFQYRVATNVIITFVYGQNEISFLEEQFFPEKYVKIIMTEWEESKFELLDIKKKYQLLKENLTDDKSKRNCFWMGTSIYSNGIQRR